MEYLLANLTAILANVSPQYGRDGQEKRFVYRKASDGAMAASDFLPWKVPLPEEQEGTEAYYRRQGERHKAVLFSIMDRANAVFALHPELLEDEES